VSVRKDKGQPRRSVLVVADRAALEEKDRAFDALDTMTFVESQRVGLLLGWPEMAGLRGDPRFVVTTAYRAFRLLDRRVYCAQLSMALCVSGYCGRKVAKPQSPTAMLSLESCPGWLKPTTREVRLGERSGVVRPSREGTREEGR
jgi:hypothetical protein